jgi:hypothetical protein
MIKLGQHLATFKRQRKAMGQPVSEQEEAQIRAAFVHVLQAPTSEAYQKALDDLTTALLSKFDFSAHYRQIMKINYIKISKFIMPS